MRRESNTPDLAYISLASNPIVAVLPSDHRLTVNSTIDPRDLAKERFINVSQTAPTLRAAIDEFIERNGLPIVTEFEADNISMATDLVASTGSVALLQADVLHLLPPALTSRPISGPKLGVELVLGFLHENRSRLLELFLLQVDELVARVGANRPPTEHIGNSGSFAAKEC